VIAPNPNERTREDLDVLNVLPNAVLVSVENRIVFANPAALQLFGVRDLATLVEREAARSHVLVEDVERIDRRLEAIARGESVPTAAEYRILRPDGSSRVVEWSTLPIVLGGQSALLYAVDDVTDLAHARDALVIAERHQREVIATLAEGVIVVDVFGVCTNANPSAVRLLGLASPEQLIGMHADLMPMLDEFGAPLGRAHHPVWRSLDTGEHVRNQIYAVAFPREVRRMRVSAIPLAEGAHQSAGAVVTFDDVTEQLDAFERTTKSEERFRKLAGIAPVAVFETDAAGVCTYVNDRWCEFSGNKPELAFGRVWTQLVHPEDQRRVQREWALAVDTSERFKAEFRFLRDDGLETFVSCEAAPIAGEAGRPVAWIGTATDLSAELALREGLRDSEARFRVLIEHSPDVVVRIVLNPWRIEYISPAIADLTGYSPEEFYAAQDLLVACIDPDDFDRVVSCFTATLNDRIECRLIHRNGSARTIEVRSNIITIDGTPTVVEATMRDVSRKAAEHELLDELAHRDELTGLANRRAVMATLDVRLAARQATSVIFLDVDGFKAINDTSGHDAGDELLKAFAGRLTSVLREDDVVGRLGGDEFVILSQPPHAEHLAQRVFAQLSTPIVLPDGSSVMLGVSAGVAHSDPAGPLQQADELLQSADRAMYEAKRRGKGQSVTFQHRTT
jgi:diguanylate cyclase (GGDEF)-like protein/PAS domain S-box-containing protein